MQGCCLQKSKEFYGISFLLRKDSNIKFPTPTLVLLILGLWPFITDEKYYFTWCVFVCVRDFFENETKLKVLRVEELLLASF